MGGTEIYLPLKTVLDEEILDSYPKSIFLLTDGQVYNENAIIQLASQHSANKNLHTEFFYKLQYNNFVFIR